MGGLSNQQNIDKRKELKVHGLAAAWAEQQTLTDDAGLGFDERLGLPVTPSGSPRGSAGCRSAFGTTLR